MTAEHDEQLELALTELTAWHGSVPQLWRRALRGATGHRALPRPRWAWLLHRDVAGVAAACIVIVIAAMIATNLPHRNSGAITRLKTGSPSQGLTGGVAMRFSPDAAAEESDRRTRVAMEELTGNDTFGAAVSYRLPDESRVALDDMCGVVASVDEGLVAGGEARFNRAWALSRSTSDGGDEEATQPRQIVRKATVELLTDDVRAVFLKAAMILSEADGEYVQVSSITGSGETAQASLTLRVAADRLSDVLNALRELGEVRSEQVAGQDVTAQVVDLEARLRNEQRVETELLDLLEKRNDAPLKEILELRTTLSNVRGEIERLTAQRHQLGRLVSLATVLVIIRTDKTQPTDFSIAGYFGDGVTRAWRRGLIFLADTFGVLLSVLVGGLIWWILLV
ncbi:MAG: DUF4349 domain-containing protein, partial [Planctomycetes bacterium]|nr:DUF4349 domain-containing protein [Planctomycetota bacterium]